MTNEEFKQYIEDHGANKALFKVTTAEQAQMALDAGAAVNKQDAYGQTPLLWAAYFGRKEVAQLLIDNGADVDAKNNDNATPLMFAAQKGHTETAQLLIEKGAGINAKDDEGSTALMFAANQGHTETAKLLIEKGADVNAKEKDGITPLMFAAISGHTKTAKLLIAKGADINANNNNGETVLDFACAHEIEMLLLKHVAVSKRKFREATEQQKQDPEFRLRLATLKKQLKSKPRLRGVSGVVVSDKIAEMKRAGKIKGDITPEMGKKLRGQIAHEMMMAKAVKTTQR